MSRDGADSFEVNGRADAAVDANQKATAFSNLLLVSAIRRATPLPSQNSSQISRSRATDLGQRSRRSQRALERGAAPLIAILVPPLAPQVAAEAQKAALPLR